MLVLRHPPLDGEVLRALNNGRQVWRLEHHLLDDLRMLVEQLWTDKTHKARPAPGRPTGAPTTRPKHWDTPERRRKLAEARARARARRAAIEAGEL